MSQTRATRNSIHSTLAGDPVLGELVAEFVAEIPGRVARIQRQQEAGDWNALRRTAHQLRGAAGSYGFEPVTPLAEQLESLLAGDAPPEEIARAVDELVAHCQRITAEAPR